MDIKEKGLLSHAGGALCLPRWGVDSWRKEQRTDSVVQAHGLATTSS